MQRVKEKHWIRIWGFGITVTAIVAAGAMSGSCVFDTRTNFCEQFGIRCGVGQECATDQAVCINSGGCGNNRRDPGEACDDGNITAGDGCSADCTSNESCGNGIMDIVDPASPKESCDDGNTRALDGCSPNCHLEFMVCGNLIVEKEREEVCDDGNVDPDDGCSANCKSNEACGNGIIDNTEPGGILHEECDSVNSFPLPANDTAICDSDCTFPACGDGHLNFMFSVTDAGPVHNEQCDSGVMGTRTDSPTCDDDCTIPACGDDHINPNFIPPGAVSGEQCDDGITNSDTVKDACRKNCQTASCGDGVQDTGEGCDDGNNIKTDACPDGPAGSAGPAGTCKDAACGDGFIKENSSEECDSSGVDTAECDGGDCTIPLCGDGHVNSEAGEDCDSGNGNGCMGQATCSSCKCVTAVIANTTPTEM